MYSSAPIEDIKARLDIVELVGETVRLTKAGGNFRGLCPFHREKSPSFMVSKDKQIWHCFGCDEGGDIFGFVMRTEHVEFPEALKILAQKAHVELQPFSPREQLAKSRRTRILEANAVAAKFYHEQLWLPQGADALAYVCKRGLKEETIRQFLIGYSPDSYTQLSDVLRRQGFSREEAAAAGLIVDRGGSQVFDRFRDRVMFPLKDANDQVVGFTARVLHENQKNMGKYVNTPETEVYHKGRMLYGLEKAKTAIRKFGYVIVVEGQMDVIASHEAGITHVVASSGTALTPEQLALLKRFTSHLLLAFDADAAGQAAARRGIEVAVQQGFVVKLITIPSGKDPDESIRHDPREWRRAIKDAKFVMDFYMDKLLGHIDLGDVSQKKRAAGELLALIAKLPDPIEQTHYLQRLSLAIRVSEQTLRDAMGRTERAAQPRAISRENVAQQKSEKQDAPVRSVSVLDAVEQELLGLVLTFPEHLPELLEQLPQAALTKSIHQRLYSQLKSWYDNKQLIDLQRFQREIALTDQEIASHIDVVMLRIEAQPELIDAGQALGAIRERIQRLKIAFLKRRMADLEHEIRLAEQVGERDRLTQLTLDFTSLSRELAKFAV